MKKFNIPPKPERTDEKFEINKQEIYVEEKIKKGLEYEIESIFKKLSDKIPQLKDINSVTAQGGMSAYDFQMLYLYITQPIRDKVYLLEKHSKDIVEAMKRLQEYRDRYMKELLESLKKDFIAKEYKFEYKIKDESVSVKLSV